MESDVVCCISFGGFHRWYFHSLEVFLHRQYVWLLCVSMDGWEWCKCWTLSSVDITLCKLRLRFTRLVWKLKSATFLRRTRPSTKLKTRWPGGAYSSSLSPRCTWSAIPSQSTFCMAYLKVSCHPFWSLSYLALTVSKLHFKIINDFD